MDRDVLERLLKERSERAMADARAAVEEAPDGQWIVASEWQVRQIFQELTRDCYQLMLQAKADEHSAAGQAAFSPSAARGAAEQGQPQPTGSDRGRSA
jgi:hypothetical protein